MNGESRRLTQAVFLDAFGMLLLEIALTRVLSYTIWYHFAYVVLSLAMLGFGASGVWLAIRPDSYAKDPLAAIGRASVGAAVATGALLIFCGLVPLDPIQLTQNSGALAVLGAYVVVGALPFTLVGLAIGIALRERAETIHSLYAWDLLGAALGCALAVPVMNWLSPPAAILFSAGAFALAGWRLAGTGALAWGALGVTSVCLLASPFAERLPFPIAHSKHLAMTEHRWNMERVHRDWTALFRLDVSKRTERTRFERNDEWGLSTTAAWPVQEPWGMLMHDGTAGASIYDLREGKLDFLDDHILKLPYLIAKPKAKVLVIGLGGGRDVIVADRFGASDITGVELDEKTVDYVRDLHPELHQGLFHSGHVHLVAGEGRHFVERTQGHWDLIQLTGVDTLAATATGAYVLAENYLYTVEAMHAFLDRLAPGGIVSMATGLWNPNEPQSAARMMNVARAALKERGASEPERNVIVVHSKLLVADVLIKNEPFTAEQIATVKKESQRLDFMPLVLGDEGHPLWRALMGPDGTAREQAIAQVPYLIEAVRDDRPFFFHFFRWGDLIDTSDTGPAHTTALSQLVLAVLALVLTAAAGIFIVLPLFVFGERTVWSRGAGVRWILGYFTAVGLGFMCFEISLMQRLVPYLGYPTYAISVVLFALLGFLGLGSFLSRRWAGRERQALPVALGLLAVLTVAYMFGIPIVERVSLGTPLALRATISVVMLAPLGLVLGLFLPLGILRAAEIHRDAVPWAWAANACASVVATVLSVVTAMEVGFSGVWMASLVLYALAVLCMLGLLAELKRAGAAA